jgi:hypothetical protein
MCSYGCSVGDAIAHVHGEIIIQKCVLARTTRLVHHWQTGNKRLQPLDGLDMVSYHMNPKYERAVNLGFAKITRQ